MNTAAYYYLLCILEMQLCKLVICYLASGFKNLCHKLKNIYQNTIQIDNRALRGSTLAWMALRSRSMVLRRRCSWMTPARSLSSSSVDSITFSFSRIQVCNTTVSIIHTVICLPQSSLVYSKDYSNRLFLT